MLTFSKLLKLRPVQSWRRSRALKQHPAFRPRITNLEDRCVPSAVSDHYGTIPLSFEANHGQADAQVQYLSRGPGYGLFLTGSEAVLSLNRSGANRTGVVGPQLAASALLRMELVGSNRAVAAAGQDQLPGTVNYFLGNDPAQWQANVPTFARVSYQSVYPGIDLVYYGNQRQLEYDFVVAPGADPAAIRLSFRGADQMSLDARGNLVLHTTGGDVIQHAPSCTSKPLMGGHQLTASFGSMAIKSAFVSAVTTRLGH